MSGEIDPKRSAQEFYATALARERTRAGLTQAQLGAKPGVIVSCQQIGHIEHCRRPPTLRFSRALDNALALEEYFEALYEAYVRESGAPTAFWEYAELEAEATVIKVYCNFTISGLLQTEECAREIIRGKQRGDMLDQLVATRMGRQDILCREEPPWLFVVLDEFAVRRILGTEAVTRRQLERLLKLGEAPNISIVVAPNGAPHLPSGSFTLLAFADRPDAGYVEAVEGHGQIIEQGSPTGDLAVLFDRIAATALSEADSAKMIRTVLEAM